MSARGIFHRFYQIYTVCGVGLCALMAGLGLAAVLFEETNRWMVGGAVGALAATFATATLVHRGAGAAVVALFCALVAGFFFHVRAPIVWAPFAGNAAIEIVASAWLRPGRRLGPRPPLADGRPGE